MNRKEFATVMTYVGLAVRQELSSESMEVYFDLLNDFSRDVLFTAAKRALLEHRWPTFPTVAEFRTAATETLQGRIKELSGTEAWALAWKAVSRIDPELDFSIRDESAKLPPVVAEAIRSMGIPALCYGKEPVAVVRSQFFKCYEELAARDRRTALMPPSIHEAIATVGNETRLPLALASVGEMPK